MRVVALIVAAIAALATDTGIFVYWIASDLACLSSCPPATGYTTIWLNGVATLLGPGLLAALVATVLAILSLGAQRRTAALIVVIATPLVIALAVVLIMQFVVGGLTPVAAGPLAEDPTSGPLVSLHWLQDQIFGALPLALWPFVTFLTALRQPESKAARAPKLHSISA